MDWFSQEFDSEDGLAWDVGSAVSLVTTAFGLSQVELLPLIFLVGLLVLPQLSAIKSVSCIVMILVGMMLFGSSVGRRWLSRCHFLS